MLQQFMSSFQLKPVERYAVKYLETLYEPDRLDELQQTEVRNLDLPPCHRSRVRLFQEQIQQRKQQWELANQERLEQEEQQRKREEDEEFDLTFNYDDSLAQVRNKALKSKAVATGAAAASDPKPYWNRNLVIRTRKARREESLQTSQKTGRKAAVAARSVVNGNSHGDDDDDAAGPSSAISKPLKKTRALLRVSSSTGGSSRSHSPEFS